MCKVGHELTTAIFSILCQSRQCCSGRYTLFYSVSIDVFHHLCGYGFCIIGGCFRNSRLGRNGRGGTIRFVIVLTFFFWLFRLRCRFLFRGSVIARSVAYSSLRLFLITFNLVICFRWSAFRTDRFFYCGIIAPFCCCRNIFRIRCFFL